MPSKKGGLVTLLAWLSVLGGCSLDYTTGMENVDETTIPTLVFEDLNQTTVRQGRAVFEMRALRAELFEKANKSILSSLEFTEYREGTEVGARGKADRAEIQTQSQDAQVQGNILLESVSDKAKLQTEKLVWRSKEKTLMADAETVVTVEKDKSLLQGQGFELNFKTSQLQFREGLTGQYAEAPREDP